jgi:hypothetical protein
MLNIDSSEVVSPDNEKLSVMKTLWQQVTKIVRLEAKVKLVNTITSIEF